MLHRGEDGAQIGCAFLRIQRLCNRTVTLKLERLFQILLQQVYDRIPPENDAVQRYEQLDSRIMVEKMRVLVQQNVMQLGICVRLVRQNDISAQHTYAKGGFDIRGCTSANFDGAAGLPPDLAQQGSRAVVPWPGLPRSADGFAILQRVTNQQKNCAEQPDCTQKQSDRQVCDRLRLAR